MPKPALTTKQKADVIVAVYGREVIRELRERREKQEAKKRRSRKKVS